MANSVADGGLTFLDYIKMKDPTGLKLMPSAAVLNQFNLPLQDGPVTPSNADLGHRVTIDTALPVTSIGKVNQGTARTKGTTEQRTEAMAMFTGKASVDIKMKYTLGATKFAGMRASQDRKFIESMSQKVANTFLYGSGTADEGGFDGIATRMGALNAPAPGTNGSQVWSKGAVVGGDGASIFIVDWNADSGVHWIYPEMPESGGLVVHDHGEDVPLNDKDGNQYFAAVTEYYWNIGIAVEDPRHIARLCNIDTSDANLGGVATQGFLVDTLLDILGYMPPADGFNRVMYCHPRILVAWRKQILNKTAPLYITMEEYLGVITPHFEGIPIRRIDQASLAESTVS